MWYDSGTRHSYRSRGSQGRDCTVPGQTTLSWFRLGIRGRSIRPLPLDDVHDDARNVVPGAHVEGELAQGLGTVLGVLVLLHHRGYLLVGHDAAEAIGAEQDAVPGADEEGLHLRPVAHFLGAEVFPEDVL